MIVLNPKDVDDVVDYSVTLMGDGFVDDEISTVEATGVGLTVESVPPVAWSSDTITFWVSGGTLGTDAKVELEIETLNGRTFQRTLVIPIRDL